jgi:hypothetical protein
MVMSSNTRPIVFSVRSLNLSPDCEPVVRKVVRGHHRNARLAVHQLDIGTGSVDAPPLVRRAFAEFTQPWWIPYAHAAGAELAVVAGFPDAERYLDAGESENGWADAALLRARARLTGDEAAFTEAAARFERIGAHFEHVHTRSLLSGR